MTDTADIHDTNDIDRLDQHFAARRDAELNARMDAEKAKTDVARSGARAASVSGRSGSPLSWAARD